MRTMQKVIEIIAGELFPPFIPVAAKILLPLTAVLKGGKKCAELLSWTQEMLKAFSAIKIALLQFLCLAFLLYTSDLSLVTDASATHVGAVLKQRSSPAEWRSLGIFFSKTREGPAVVQCL